MIYIYIHCLGFLFHLDMITFMFVFEIYSNNNHNIPWYILLCQKRIIWFHVTIAYPVKHLEIIQRESVKSFTHSLEAHWACYKIIKIKKSEDHTSHMIFSKSIFEVYRVYKLLYINLYPTYFQGLDAFFSCSLWLFQWDEKTRSWRRIWTYQPTSRPMLSDAEPEPGTDSGWSEHTIKTIGKP